MEENCTDDVKNSSESSILRSPFSYLNPISYLLKTTSGTVLDLTTTMGKQRQEHDGDVCKQHADIPSVISVRMIFRHLIPYKTPCDSCKSSSVKNITQEFMMTFNKDDIGEGKEIRELLKMSKSLLKSINPTIFYDVELHEMKDGRENVSVNLETRVKSGEYIFKFIKENDGHQGLESLQNSLPGCLQTVSENNLKLGRILDYTAQAFGVMFEKIHQETTTVPRKVINKNSKEDEQYSNGRKPEGNSCLDASDHSEDVTNNCHDSGGPMHGIPEENSLSSVPAVDQGEVEERYVDEEEEESNLLENHESESSNGHQREDILPDQPEVPPRPRSGNSRRHPSCSLDHENRKEIDSGTNEQTVHEEAEYLKDPGLPLTDTTRIKLPPQTYKCDDQTTDKVPEDDENHTLQIKPTSNPEIMRSLFTRESKIVTILMFGDQGIGKTTFVNAFYHYTMYNAGSFDELLNAAQRETPKYLISGKFLLNKYALDISKFNCSPPRLSGFDETYTKTSTIEHYDIPIETRMLRLIDMPGMNVGSYLDEEHVNEVISSYPNIDFIFYCLEPNITRKTTKVTTELDLLQKIEDKTKAKTIFCAMKAKINNFKGANTFSLLQEEYGVKADPEKSLYYFDNDPYLYLWAIYRKVRHTMDQSDVEHLWKQSNKFLTNLIDHVLN